MTEPAIEPGEPSPGSTTFSYSPRLCRAFNLAALAVALLPIPVMLLHLLPAYPAQARFLVVYAPLVCLLTLAYLFYVRDSLARMMFAHLLDPLPPRPRYYPERNDIRLRRLWMRTRRAALAVLPGLLLVGSLACVMRYMARLGDSAAVAGVSLTHGPGAVEDVGLLPTDRSPGDATQTPLLGQGTTSRPDSGASAAPATAGIPYFTELTALYIGSFLAALVALVLMGLREYAKQALGLSETDVVLGRILAEPE